MRTTPKSAPIPSEPCDRFESTCETLAGLSASGGEGGLSGDAEEAMRAHASGCAPCAGAVRAAEALRRSQDARDVPEPGPSYWESFSERLDARLRASDASLTAGATRRSRALGAALALAASAALIAGALAVRHLRGVSLDPPPEAELLERLDRAPAEGVAEYLDEIAPPELAAAPEDLAEVEDLLHDDGTAGSDDDSPYDLFLDLGDEDRDRLLKEMRGEIG